MSTSPSRSIGLRKAPPFSLFRAARLPAAPRLRRTRRAQLAAAERIAPLGSGDSGEPGTEIAGVDPRCTSLCGVRFQVHG